MRWAFAFLVLLLMPAGLAATLTGTAYTQNLAVAQYAILTINTTPEQRLILDDGMYNITVPPGTYLLSASLRQSGQRYEDEVLVRAVDDGVYAYDLILFRVETIDPVLDDTEDPTTDLEFPQDGADSPISPIRRYVLGGIVLVALIALAMLGARGEWWRHKSKGDAPVAHPKKKGSADLPDDLTQVLAILKSEGGRANQKELRQKLPYSEAKVSMMLADLENRGLLKRVKQGRANLIVLK